MAVTYRHVQSGRIVVRPEPGDSPQRRSRQRGREIAKLDASPQWQRVDPQIEQHHPPPGVDDPGECTVRHVNAYLAVADPAERERVLQAEADGKARVRILNGPHANQTGE